ncbi:VanZ family protein [Desertihabitans aurantiacus]|uniref:VanZ family protein n=1 Tax=Desertihabitans aurantiacus TaxID=2282477 RepID=UPI001300AD1E|nr:VanZ family protein [Desertihabitans aurantiacus]
MIERFAGTATMVLGALVLGVVLLLVAVAARRRVGTVAAFARSGLLWSLLVIALVTLVPLDGIDLERPVETAQQVCSLDYGGPAPDRFLFFSGGQRMLNTVLFVPAGAFLVLVATRWRAGWLLALLGLGVLAAYSVGIEITQLELSRIGRACDVTDIVDNVLGAGLGGVLGALLAVVLRPWRERRRRR